MTCHVIVHIKASGMSVMFESNRIADMFTDKHVRVKPGHYIDTLNDTDCNACFELWVRHGPRFYIVNTDDWTCRARGRVCEPLCKQVTLTDKQKRNTVAFIALYNRR